MKHIKEVIDERQLKVVAQKTEELAFAIDDYVYDMIGDTMTKDYFEEVVKDFINWRRN